MSDWVALGLLAIGFYLYECCTWTPATAFACFRKPLRQSWHAAAGAELPGNESGGFALSDPLTFSGNYIQCAAWPIAISPDGVCIDSAEATQFWPFESIRTISAHEKSVRFNGDTIIRTASETLARELASQLGRCKELPPARRSEPIRAAINQSLDPNMVRSAWSGFLKSSRALNVLAALPLLWLAVITPIVMYLFGPLATWPYLLGGLLLCALAVCAEFIRVHRKELPNVSDRWLHAVSMTLFPIAAIRAADRISKERLAHFNPATIVGVFCSDAEGDPILRRIGFDLEQPIAPSPDPQIARCREWFRAQQRSAFAGLLTSIGRHPFAQPQRTDPSMSSYCPRCHSQFSDGVAECSDCDAAHLTRF